MGKSWKDSWNDRKEILAAGSGWMAMSHICAFIAFVFLLLGIISDAINKSLGLEPTSWLLLAIFTLVLGIPSFVGWHSALHLDAKKTETEKEE